MTARAERNEWRQRAEDNQEAAAQLTLVQQESETYKLKANESEERATQNHQLYLKEQQQYQQTLCLYQEEKVKADAWLTKYEEADNQRKQYLTLYNNAKEELRYERRSKASIKGWETRRKRDNKRLKLEIFEMTVMLRESLARKDEAVSNLYILAERMDRIQGLVDSVEESTNTPINLLQKLKRVWHAIKDILEE